MTGIWIKCTQRGRRVPESETFQMEMRMLVKMWWEWWHLKPLKVGDDLLLWCTAKGNPMKLKIVDKAGGSDTCHPTAEEEDWGAFCRKLLNPNQMALLFHLWAEIWNMVCYDCGQDAWTVCEIVFISCNRVQCIGKAVWPYVLAASDHHQHHHLHHSHHHDDHHV